eukprot:9120022-Lingulodinium_polyedra.AAC.1
MPELTDGLIGTFGAGLALINLLVLLGNHAGDAKGLWLHVALLKTMVQHDQQADVPDRVHGLSTVNASHESAELQLRALLLES